MKAVPIAVPVAWSSGQPFFLQADGFARRSGSDCLPQRRPLR
jgi:hypothetical protein